MILEWAEKVCQRILHKGIFPDSLFFFAIPFMASNALQVLYSTIDMIIVGEFVGTPGLSAVSQSSQIVNFATMVCLGFSNAGQVLLAQALAIENAVDAVLEAGFRPADIAHGEEALGTVEMTDKILEYI